jgi:ribosomal protein L7/L12
MMKFDITIGNVRIRGEGEIFITAVHTPAATYRMRLHNIGEKVIAVIREVRTWTGLQLRDAKNLVDDVRYRAEVREVRRGMSREESGVMAEAFRSVGATVDVLRDR